MCNKNTINVNGSMIDKDYFESNVEEALTYEWKPLSYAGEKSHVHCMVCNSPLAKDDFNYKSEHHFLCGYCCTHFVKPGINGNKKK